MTESTQTQSKAAEKHKITVAGVEKELTYDELVSAAQKGEDYQKKTTELAEQRRTLEVKEKELEELKRIRDTVEGNPKLKETITKVISDFQSGKSSSSSATLDKNLKLIDKRIEEASDGDTKEQLREIRQIISEETEFGSLKEENRALKDRLDRLEAAGLINLSDRIESQLSDLSERFGKEVVDKYKDDLKILAQKYPRQALRKVFFNVASDEDTRLAVLNEAKTEKEREVKLKTNGSTVPPGSVQTKIEPVRDRKGRVDWGAWIQKKKEAGQFNA